MPHIRPSFPQLNRPRPLVMLVGCILLLLSLQACDHADPTSSEGIPSHPAEYAQDLSHPVFVHAGATFSLRFSANQLSFRGLGAEQRATFDAPELLVTDTAGEEKLHLTAKSALTLHPYPDISFSGFSLQNAEATTFEGEELVWPYDGQDDRVGMLGATLLFAPAFMVECDTILGDLLFRGYEILHVKAAMDLDESADSEDGHGH